MITQEQIEAKGFVEWQDRGPEPFVTNSKEYIALGTLKTGDERVRPLILRHFDSGILYIQDYFNDAKLYREFYFHGEILLSTELDAAIEGLPWTVSAIDLTKVTTNYA
jgi:hypothetical protein